jgi:hypothetical protein
MLLVSIFAFLIAVLLGSMLAYGLSIGRMPARSVTYDRKRQPRYFWFMAAVYGGAAVFFICITLRCAGIW